MLDTAVWLRGMAWESGGRITPPFTPDMFRQLSGTPQATLYSHLAALRTKGWLLSRPAQRGTGQIIVEFPDAVDSDPLENSAALEDSSPPESPAEQDELGPKVGAKRQFSSAPEHSSAPESTALKSLIKPDSKDKPSTNTKEGADSSASEKSLMARKRAIQDAYLAELGYKLKSGEWSAGESRAAGYIAEDFSVEQLVAAYRHYKAQKFWADKRLTLRYLAGQMAEFVGSRRRPGAGHRADDPAASAQLAALVQAEKARVAREENR
jgi:hypothetical protein